MRKNTVHNSPLSNMSTYNIYQSHCIKCHINNQNTHMQMPHNAASPEGSFLVTDGCLGVPGPAVKQVMLVVPQLIQELHCNSLKGFEAGEVLQQQLGYGYCLPPWLLAAVSTQCCPPPAEHSSLGVFYVGNWSFA